MGKTIVVMLDGTWNQPEPFLSDEASGVRPTNVYLTWLGLGGSGLENSEAVEAIERTTCDECDLLLIYVRGVGTRGTPLERRFAGATGIGVSRRIRTAYRLLASDYVPGDRIFIFGFSRGAFAARSLAGMIERRGVAAGDDEAVEREYRGYRAGAQAWADPIEIAYVGLWDTVSAIPMENTPINLPHELRPANVKAVRHALALDEVRSPYQPIFWLPRHPWQDVTECWFAGAHSNIGGGYTDQNLSNIALFWVLSGARRAGPPIEFRWPGLLAQVLNLEQAGTALRDSYKDFWDRAKRVGRMAAGIGAFRECREIMPRQQVHESVWEAMQPGGYRPQALFNGGPLAERGLRPVATLAWDVNDDGSLVV